MSDTIYFVDYVTNFPTNDSSKNYAEMLGIQRRTKSTKTLLYDHRPLELNADDCQRVCRIPKKKVLFIVICNLSDVIYIILFLQIQLSNSDFYCCQGSCFRDLPGVRVGTDNKVEWDPDMERIYLDSGKPLVT